MPSDPVPLLAIFAVFLRIGAFSFGGGLSGWIFREVVLLRPWLTEEDFFSGLALSQMLPGANVTNLAVYIGQRLRGVPGAIVALVGLVAAPFVAVLALVVAYDRIRDVSALHAVMDGLAAAAIGLLILVAGKAAVAAGRRWPGLVALLATFVSVGLLQWPLVPTVLIVAPLSVAGAWFTREASDA